MALSIRYSHLGDGSSYKKRQTTQPAQDTSFSSSWSDRIEDLYHQIEGRKFSYNQQDDPLYQQYRSMYEQNAKLAMQDTVGQVSAMTGGYGNSYAQTAGQAVYNQHMGQMNEKALELRNAALNEYQMEGDKLLQMYSISGDMYNREYNEYRDSVSDQHWAQEFAENQRQFNENLAWEKQNAAANRAASRSSSLASAMLSRSSSSGSSALTPSEQLAREKFEYQKERDAISDEQYADSLAYKYAALYAKGSGSTGSSKSGSGTKKSGDQKKVAKINDDGEKKKPYQQKTQTDSHQRDYDRRVKEAGGEDIYYSQMLNRQVAAGQMTPEEMEEEMEKFYARRA
ncbi:MAG: hypothetical protein IK080_01860 [Clostridia bacterium]|nr:hypothetical protein [Clostridia bacterium]